MKYIWAMIAMMLLCSGTFADETPPCYTYDAVRILGIGTPVDKPLPGPKPGEIIIRCGNWSMLELEESPAVKGYLEGSTLGRLFSNQKLESTADEWYTQKMPAGTYRLRLVVLETKNKSREEQRQFLRKDEDEMIAPVVLVATALIVHRIQTGEQLLVRDNVRIIRQDDKDWPHVTTIRCGTSFKSDPEGSKALVTKQIEWDQLYDHKSLSVQDDVATAKFFTLGMGFMKKID